MCLQQSQLGPGEVGEMGDQMYQLKTMCLAKKTVQMPTKEEHGFLLFCGLGELKKILKLINFFMVIGHPSKC